jgi:phosphatidylglycerophosphate synthase
MLHEVDLLCALASIAAAAAFGIAYAARRSSACPELPRRDATALPAPLVNAAVAWLSPVARRLCRAGVSANTITLSGLALALIAAAFIAAGWFGIAGALMIAASLADALDGLVARESRSASVGGALLDAAVDRYEELLFLSGIAVYLRSSATTFGLVMLAIVGSFMVSYASAKAESLRLPAPGAMRRPERAVCLCAGVTLEPIAMALVARGWLPDWTGDAPLLAALTIVAIGSNVSSVRRLRRLAQSSARPLAR